MTVTVLRQRDLFSFILPDKSEGQYQVLTDDGKMAASIDNIGGQWLLTAAPDFELAGNVTDTSCTPVVENFSLVVRSKANQKSIYIMFEALEEGKTRFSKYYISRQGSYTIGRDEGADIRYDSPLISHRHATLHWEANGVWIEDHNTPNGTYVNGLRISGKTKLHDGDLIYIVGLKIIYAQQLLGINQPEGLSVSGRLNKIAVQKSKPTEHAAYEHGKNARQYSRSPRFANRIDPVEIQIDPPPAPVVIQTMPVAYLLGPSITMGVASVFTAVFTILNAQGDLLRVMPTLIMAFSMLTMTVLWPILTRRYEKKQKIEAEKKRKETYNEYLKEKKQEIQSAVVRQESVLKSGYLSSNEVAEAVRTMDRKLWERSPWHADYLTARLGLGNRRLIGSISCPERHFKVQKDELEEKMYQLASADYVLKDIPITVQFTEVITGVIGNQKSIENLIRSIVIQLSTLHSHDECKLFAVVDPNRISQWRFLYDLPHCWDDNYETRNVICSQRELGVAAQKLSQIFETRKTEFESGNKKNLDKRYVLILMDKDIVSTNTVIQSIIEYKEYLGISIIAAYGSMNMLPRLCTQIIEVSESGGRVYNRYSDESGYTSFKPDKCSVDTHRFGAALSNIISDEAEKAISLPSVVTFLEMMRVGRVEHLNCLSRWNQNSTAHSIDAELGINEQGAPFILDLHEKNHGPHGLIAGMTGSGKSELIMTLILSLAVKYHPYDVAFVLIDFKGGGMAKAFASLPHTVGIITNLDGNEVKRSLASINSELRKRQQAFAAASSLTGESNIDIYKYQQLYKSGAVSEPIPHLFIISDEFAELKAQYPDFMAQLISAARIGRSLGVHLILATQKPAGVVDDQIWSNSKFRICLKVQDRNDSMDVIKRPDAAELNVTGRFFLQVGYNELFETGQSAWSGAPYFPADRPQSKADDALIVVDHLGHQLLSVSPDRAPGLVKQTGKQIDSVVRYLCKTAETQNISLPALWRPALPDSIGIHEITDTIDYRSALSVLCGMVDDPDNQDQYPLVVDMIRDGNVLIYGISGSGRTTFLSTIIYQLITHYSPEEVNIHIIDCGTGSLNAFQKAPHIGYSLSISDATDIDPLFSKLKREVSRRKDHFAKIGGDFSTISGSRQGLPAIFVVINNYAGFYEIYDEKEDDIASLTREGAKYGVFFLVSGSAMGSVRNRVAQNFKQIFVLQMNDRGDYSAILGSTGGVYPAGTPGRGIFKTGQSTYEFQVGYIHDPNDFSRFGHFASVAEQLLSRFGGDKPDGLKRGNTAVNAETMLPYFDDSKPVPAFPVGMDPDTDEPMYLHFTSEKIVPVVSQGDCHLGFARQLIHLLSAKGIRQVVVDVENALRVQKKETVTYISDASALNAAIVDFVDEMIARFKKKKSGEVKDESAFPPVVLLINNFESMERLLNDHARHQLFDLLENGSALGLMVVVCGSASSVTAYSASGWYRKRFSHADGMWIGPGYDRQIIFTSARPYRQSDIKSDSCYLLNKGILQYGRRMIDPAEQRR